MITIVPENERLDFLPNHFGKHFLMLENLVYSFAEKMIDGYVGGYWEFAYADTDCVAPFMFFKEDDVKMTNLFSGDEVEVDGILAGMIVSIYAIEYLVNEVFDDALIDKLDALKDSAGQYAADHGFSSQYFTMTD